MGGQVVIAGAWNVSSKGQGVNSHPHIRDEPLAAGTKLGTPFLACVTLTHSSLSSQVATLASGLGPLNGHGLAPLPCGKGSLDSPSPCWACSRITDGTWGAVHVHGDVPGGHGVTISTESKGLSSTFPHVSAKHIRRFSIISFLDTFLWRKYFSP